MDELTREIKVARTRLNLTQQDVANRLEIACASYIKYENNPLNMSLSMFIKLSDILGEEFRSIFFTQQLYSLYNNNEKEI